MNETKRILIEWRHLEFGEILCGRCTDTGTNLLNVISKLGQEYLLDDVELELKNTILSPERSDESNTVIINGIPIENILKADVTFTECTYCSDQIGEPAFCRAEATDKDIFKAIPEEILRAAILKTLNRVREV